MGQVSYAIGVAHPISVFCTGYGTSKYSDAQLTKIVNFNFDLRPGVIVRELDLKKPIYQATSSYGHFADQNSPGNRQKPSKCQRTYKSRREKPDFRQFNSIFTSASHKHQTIPRNGCTKLLMGRSFCNYSDRFFSIKLFDLRAFL